MLREVLPTLAARQWIAATAGAAALAWSLGMLPSTTGEHLDGLPALVLAPAFTVGGIVLLFSIGGAQALVLRTYVEGAWRWAGANALAWFVAVVVSVSLMSVLLTEDTTLPTGIAVGAAAGVLMGAIVAVVTGWFLVRILELR